ncbi:hypothetical protein P3W33_09105 [Luteibacter sp. PPL552]
MLFNKASRTEAASLDAADRVAYVNLYEQEEEGEYWSPRITFVARADWTDPPY